MLNKIRQSGFTLVELLVALTLTVLLMVSILGVTASAARQREFFVSHNDRPVWLDRLGETLTRDLIHADYLKADDNQIILETLAMVDPADRMLSHRRVCVMYRLQRFGSESWLVRIQHQPEALSNEKDLTMLAAVDVWSFELLDDPATTEESSGGWPKRMIFRLHAGNRDVQAMEINLNLR